MNAFQFETRHLKAAAFFASKEESRYYLCGVLVEIRAGALFIVATDGHRLFCAKRFHDGADPDDMQLIIPSDAIKKALSGHKGELCELAPVVGAAGANLYALNGVQFQPIDGAFPDWRRVVPTSASGDVAQFDPNLVGDLGKAAKILGSNVAHIAHNGGAPAAIGFGEENANCFAVLMPFRSMVDQDKLLFDVNDVIGTNEKTARILSAA